MIKIFYLPKKLHYCIEKNLIGTQTLRKIRYEYLSDMIHILMGILTHGLLYHTKLASNTENNTTLMNYHTVQKLAFNPKM